MKKNIKHSNNLQQSQGSPDKNGTLMLLCSVQEDKPSSCTYPCLNKCITRLHLHEHKLELEFHQQDH